MVFNDTPSTVLAVYAHPDDMEVSCGGTLARWARLGSSIYSIVCNKGDKGSIDAIFGEDNNTDESLAEKRKEESLEAARVLGIKETYFLGYPDGEIKNDQALRQILVKFMRHIKPHLLICPDPTAVFFGNTYYNHVDHREVGWAVLDSGLPACSNPNYFKDAGSPHVIGDVFMSGTLNPNYWVDITEDIEKKVNAILCHKSRVGNIQDSISEIVFKRASREGSLSKTTYAEAFSAIRLSNS